MGVFNPRIAFVAKLAISEELKVFISSAVSPLTWVELKRPICIDVRAPALVVDKPLNCPNEKPDTALLEIFAISSAEKAFKPATVKPRICSDERTPT